ncbi:MAG: metal ABC transporter ATP-binding protein [Bacilli bacterium]
MQDYSNKTSTTSNKPLAIELSDVSVSFGKFCALKNVSFSINKGDFLYIVGPNGSGKTTLIKLMVGVIEPTLGKVHINSDNLGYLPQKFNYSHQFPVTVREVIYSGCKKQRIIATKKSKALIKTWLKKMEIEHLSENSMANLSGGEQQRVFLIRALINKPNLLIMDEPTSALDPKFRRHFNEIINRLSKEGVTIIYVTHDLHDRVDDNAKIMYVDQTVRFFGNFNDYAARSRGEDNV